MDTENFFVLSAKNIDGEVVQFKQYLNKVVLVASVGFHEFLKYKLLELKKLQDQYKDKNFVILAFTCSDFGDQYTAEQIKEIAIKNEINFQFFEKISIQNAKENQVFDFLLKKSSVENMIAAFECFIVAKDGRHANRFDSGSDFSSTSFTQNIDREFEKDDLPLKHVNELHLLD